MDTQQPPAMPEVPQGNSLSLTDRLTDIFFSPGEVFDDIRIGPPKWTGWVVPLVIAILVGIIGSTVIFSQPAVVQQIRDAQMEALRKEWQKQVSLGKMTQEQADGAAEKVESFFNTTTLKIFGAGGAVVMSAIQVFMGALVLWLIGRFAFKAQVEYMQMAEVAGICMMIVAVGGLATTLLISNYGDTLATASPALLLDHRDIKNVAHVALSKLEVFSIWYVAVLSLGLARVSGTSWLKAAVWVVSIWILFTGAPLLMMVAKK